jgi:PAS domain S-box-containing protein
MISAADILKASILIVDDQAANIMLLEQMLQGEGYSAISSTRDPLVVCALHREHRYDLILLDLQMPGMDGFEVMEGLKEIEPNGFLPVLVITAQPGHKLRALRAGARDFVSKPFDLAEVLIRVHNMLEIRLLHQSEVLLNNARLNNAQRIASLGDWEYVVAPHRLVWSDEIYRILGLVRPAGPPDKNDFGRRIHPDDLELFRAAKKLASDRGMRADFEYRIIRPDGAVRHIRQISEMSLDEHGQLTGESGTMQDITDRKSAAEALQMSEKRFKALFEQAAVGVAQANATTGRLMDANPRYCEIVGYSWVDLEDMVFAPVTHPQDIEKDRRMHRQLLDGTIREFSHEKRYIRKDGTEVWATLTVSAMWAIGETPDYFIAVVQDITERKQLEEHFLQAQKMEALGQFSSGVAHDFNNILAVISGYAELARMTVKDSPKVVEHLDAVLQASGRATDLVRQILTFSRQQPQQRRPIKLQPLIAESLKLLRSTIPSTIEFETTVAEDAPTVLADINQIHQILMNLGINAWHAMKQSPGRLQMKLERCIVDASHAAVQPRLRPGVYARVSVTDTGCGMDRATLRRIFEPFFTTKPVGQGTGLGLSVVHGIMDNHEGAVTVYSQPGEGTIFHLYFPGYAGEAIMLETEQGPVPRGQGERILVVDDEELLAQLCQQTLSALGYEVEITTVPGTALALVRSDPRAFDLVLTDQTMPGMTGIVLATELHVIRRDLPIILMTGYSATLTPEGVEAVGIHQLMLKPTGIHALGTAVHAALTSPTSSH